VGDDKGGAPGQDSAQRGLHGALTRDVEQGCRLVQDKYGGGGQEGSCEGDELALPRGEPAAALAHLGVVAPRQRGDERVGADGRRGRLDLPAARAGLAEPDVVRDGPAEEKTLLG